MAIESNLATKKCIADAVSKQYLSFLYNLVELISTFFH